MKMFNLIIATVFAAGLVTALADQTKTNTPTTATMSTPANTNEVAVITTTEGTMVIEFWPDVAPKTVENFKTLANKGFSMITEGDLTEDE